MRPEPIYFRVGEGRIAAEECGDLQGEPVFFFHGWPSSRLQGQGFGAAAKALGLRIIALDRPGMGCSSHSAERRLLDWPPVVASIAREMGFARYRVLGISGGGPYTLATAWALPEQVESAAVVCGAPPLDSPQSVAQLFFAYRWMLALYHRRPGMLRWLFRVGRPVVTIRPPRRLVALGLKWLKGEADAAALCEPATYDGTFECYREAWRESALGVALDGELYASPWGFAPEEIRVPVQLWHGSDDRHFAHPLAERLAHRIPKCEYHLVEGEGHFSLPFNHAREILERLVVHRTSAATLQGDGASLTALPSAGR